jgi:hypothetical protein
MWAFLWTTLRFPIVGSLVAFGILVAIDQLILPLHHAAASAEGILFMESAVLVLLLGGLVWDKTQAIRRSLQLKRPKHHELFTWNEIGKVLACLAASMFIFVVVVKALDLKAVRKADEGDHHGGEKHAAPEDRHVGETE